MAGYDITDHRIRLFRSEPLERMTLFGPKAFALFWLVAFPALVLVAAWLTWGEIDLWSALALTVGGLVFWTFFEYWFHRHLFHWKSRFAPVRWLVFLLHGNHHACPADPQRNLMPPTASVPLGGLVWLTMVSVLDAKGHWLFVGFMAGYLAYDVTHYACHQWRMKGRISGAIKRHHMRHHHVDGDRNYAITAIYLDRLFGTAIERNRRPD